jgi:hypothetical protein
MNKKIIEAASAYPGAPFRRRSQPRMNKCPHILAAPKAGVGAASSVRRRVIASRHPSEVLLPVETAIQ